MAVENGVSEEAMYHNIPGENLYHWLVLRSDIDGARLTVETTVGRMLPHVENTMKECWQVPPCSGKHLHVWIETHRGLFEALADACVKGSRNDAVACALGDEIWQRLVFSRWLPVETANRWFGKDPYVAVRRLQVLINSGLSVEAVAAKLIAECADVVVLQLRDVVCWIESVKRGLWYVD